MSDETTTNPGASGNKSTQPASSRARRKKRKKRNVVGRKFSNVIDAEVEFLGGFAEAIGHGIKAFGEELPERSSSEDADWSRSIVSGATEGYVRFLEELSKVVRNTSEILLEEEEQSDKE